MMPPIVTRPSPTPFSAASQGEPAQPLRDLQRLVGLEQAVEHLHGMIRSAAKGFRPSVSGTCLVTCADEYLGEFRAGFDRDVARHLASSGVKGARRTFTIRNVGGRIEAGTLSLVDAHYSSGPAGSGTAERVLLFEIAAHVGRTAPAGGAIRFGDLERCGSVSPCCGALAILLGPDPGRPAHPWVEELEQSFGERRLEPLRASDDSTRMVIAAVVHALLQAEILAADVLNSTLESPAHVLIAATLVVHRSDRDSALLCGVHHLRGGNGATRLEHAFGLRTTPAALRVEGLSGQMTISCIDPGGTEASEERVRSSSFEALTASVADDVQRDATRETQRLAGLVREQVVHLERRAVPYRVYVRPLLRALLDGLAVVAPELSVVGWLAMGGGDLARAARLRRLLKEGPHTSESRAALREVERQVHQLPHRDAKEVLDYLLAENGPLLAGPTD